MRHKRYHESPNKKLEFFLVHALCICVDGVSEPSQAAHIVKVCSVISDDLLAHLVKFIVVEV